MSAPVVGPPVGLFGLMAEFPDPKSLAKAAERTYKAGYRKVEAYTPFPVEEVIDALHHHHSKVPLLVLIGGILGGLGGFGLQMWANLSAYPMNVGGRPLISWPAFIVPTFECTILGASLTAVIGMFALNGRKAQPSNYALLEELDTRPRTTYLAKITNPNPQLSGAERS